MEVDYLILEEWANYCDDILNRRTKLGLTMDNASKKELADYLASISTYPSAQAELVFH